MESFHLHCKSISALSARSGLVRGFTTKQARQERDSDFSLASARREQTNSFGFTTKQARQERDSDFSLASARREQTQSSGFTLIELMVVLAIIVTITSVVLTSQSAFNKTLILANTAYDVALSLRGAATYGLGGHAISMMPTGYGMHFELSTPGSFTLFADTYPAPSALSVCHAANDPSTLDAQPGNCSYESGQDVTVTTYALGNNITVSDFCAYASGAWSCAYAQGGGLTALDIVFARPDSDPFMSVNRSYSAVSPVTNACLTISSPLGGERYVAVSSTGRITANAASCP